MSRIFISYSHRGRGPEWKAALLRALAVFEQQHLLDVWEDGKIRVSAYWQDDIEKAMEEAQLAIVLLTEEALKSDFILTKELPCLRDRQQNDKLPVFPVICEPCDWRAHDWLRATQAPNASNPLSDLKSAEQDHVFRQLATDIAKALSLRALAALPTADGHLPDEKIYLDRFPLTRGPGLREEKLIGREQELALLDLAFAQPHTAILTLVAWGGVGKTMLVQHWLRRLESGRVHEDDPANPWLGARRVYAWSFYSQGTNEDRQASEDMFLAHALEWFGVQCEPTLSPWDKGRLLADAIARERTLLILDGIEPLQYPPGPMGGQLRAPGVQSLLKQLARRANAGGRGQKSEISGGLCLVTTREPLTDLADFQRREGSSWGSVLRVDLGNLTDEAGAALLHHAGAKRAGAAEIKPDDTELLAASREVDGHALTLNLLGRFLVRAHGGDIRRRDLVKFEEADRKEQGGTTFKMLAAFENWFARSGEFGARQLAVLRMLGLFDRPADAECIAVLRKLPVIQGLTEPLFSAGVESKDHMALQPIADEDLNAVISFLADFDLITIKVNDDQLTKALDCHPLIRQHFATKLSKYASNSWRYAHRRFYEYLRDNTVSRPDKLQDLQRLYQAVAHGCAAGSYEDAKDEVLDPRIRRGSSLYGIKSFGVWGTHLAAVSSFFDVPWTKLHADIEPDSKAWLFNEAGFCLRSVGRLFEAYEALQVAAEVATQLEDFQEAAKYTSNLGELALTLGRISEAVEVTELALNLGSTKDRQAAANFAFLAASNNQLNVHWRTFRRDLALLAHSLYENGALRKALSCFLDAERVQAMHQPQMPQLYSTGGFYFNELLMTELENAAWRKHLGLPLKVLPSDLLLNMHNDVLRRGMNNFQIELDSSRNILDMALAQLTLGCATFYAKALSLPTLDNMKSTKLLADAEIGLRRSGASHHIPRGLLSRARQYFVQGDALNTINNLDEAWDIAERGPMRLHLADIHLYRARLFFREKPYPWKSPQDDLAAAQKLINDCGYHRRDEELADAKRAILG